MAVARGDQLRHLRRQEAFEPADALDLAELGLDPLFQRLVPILELVGLLLQLVGLLAHGGMRGREFAALLVHLGEQPRVAHRQHRLVREGAHQPDQIGREFAGVLAAAPPAIPARPSGRPAAPPAPNESRPRSRRRAADGRRHRSRSAIAIGSPLVAASPSRLAPWSIARCSPSARLVDADRFGEIEAVVGGVIAVDQHRVGMGDFERARRHRRQHRIEIERRGHRAADLFQHLEFVDRLREVAGALLHLGLEAGIGFRKLPGHAVELARRALPVRPRCGRRCGG